MRVSSMPLAAAPSTRTAAMAWASVMPVTVPPPRLLPRRAAERRVDRLHDLGGGAPGRQAVDLGLQRERVDEVAEQNERISAAVVSRPVSTEPGHLGAEAGFGAGYHQAKSAVFQSAALKSRGPTGTIVSGCTSM